LLLCGLPFSLLSQNNNDEVFNYFDQYYSSDPFLVNGSIVTNNYSGYMGHPFFKGDEFQSVDIFVKNHHYSGVPARYNIVNDLLQIKISTSYGANLEIAVVPSYIDSFRIYNTVFCHLDENSSAFYEILADACKYKIYSVHGKSLKIAGVTGSSSMYYSDENVRFFIYNGEELTKIKKIKDFKTILTESDFNQFKMKFKVGLKISDCSKKDLSEILSTICILQNE